MLEVDITASRMLCVAIIFGTVRKDGVNGGLIIKKKYNHPIGL